MDDDVFIQPDLIPGARLNGKSDPRIPADVAKLAMLGQMPCNKFVSVHADPHD